MRRKAAEPVQPVTTILNSRGKAKAARAKLQAGKIAVFSADECIGNATGVKQGQPIGCPCGNVKVTEHPMPGRGRGSASSSSATDQSPTLLVNEK